MSTAPIPSFMTAWSRPDYGSADAVRLVETPVPSPGAGEVLVKIHATALNAGDVRLMLGDPLLVRLAFGMRGPRQPIRGMDVAGTVVSVGDGVSIDRLGEEIIVELSGGGGLAPFAVVRADRLAGRPADLDPVVAATLPIAGGTAVQALDLATVSAGQRVLVLGASGGVGTFAVQLAVARGAEIWATCGAGNRALIESLGATRTFDYRATSASELPAASFDTVIDLAASAPLRQLRRLLAPSGTLVMVAAGDGRALGPIPRMIHGSLLSLGSRRRIRVLAATTKPETIDQLVELTVSGRISPVMESIRAFSDAGAALERMESGHAVGKVVVLAERDQPVP